MNRRLGDSNFKKLLEIVLYEFLQKYNLILLTPPVHIYFGLGLSRGQICSSLARESWSSAPEFSILVSLTKT